MIEIVAMPVLGGIIGYITNDIAIKMLFRPGRALYIGRLHIPFTPGLIPRQRERIAASIGNVISTQLLNRDAILNTVTSDENINRVYSAFMNLAENMKSNERRLEEIIEDHISHEDMDMYGRALQERITLAIASKINETDVGTRLAQSGIEMLKEKSGMGFLSMLIGDDLVSKLGGVINNVLREKAPEIIYDELGKASEDILSMRICDIITKYEDSIPGILRGFIGLCKIIIEENTDRILKLVNIEQIVFDKVSSFDAAELEQMIFGIMHKELKAIVYLGAVLGFIMGFINLIFLFI